MQDELLDIVDENNKLTGQSAPRSQVHTQNLWHRIVHIYIFRKNGDKIEFLVHLRSPLKDRHPNKWDTRFGGHIKSGATQEECLKSELKEEIGLDADGHKFIEGYWQKKDKPPRAFNKIYFLEFYGDFADLKFNDGEVQEVKWMNIEEIKDSMKKESTKWAPKIEGFIEISEYLKDALKSSKLK